MIHTLDNPKLVDIYYCFKGIETFSGVVKDKRNIIAYHLNGNLHREDGPAVETADGYKYWYLNDKYYGENDNFTNESWIRFTKLLLLK